MASEETEASSRPPLAAVEDPTHQEDKSSSKENSEVSEIVEVQTLHHEVELVKEDEGQHFNVTETGAEAGNNNEVKIIEVDVEAEATDRTEDELQPPGSEAEAGSGHHSEIKAEAEAADRTEDELQPPEGEAEAGSGHHGEIKVEAGAKAELDSQAGDDSKAPAGPESEADNVGTAEVEDNEEDEKPHKLTVDDIKTAPMDFRFPTTNQAKHCFTRYVEYHKCVQAGGDDSSDCNKYARFYRSLCPGEWVDKWNEQRENGTFPGPL